jgi:pimeloyl-ACP methyl ester carboxylesterase
MDVLINCIRLSIEAYGDDGKKGYISEMIDGTLYVAFRGSSSFMDWIRNLFFWRKRGFHAGFAKTASEMFLEASRLIQDHENVVLTGHSQGGAEAFYFALKLHKHVQMVVTYGSPRCMSKKLAREYLIHNIETINVQYEGDIVAHVPASWLGFAHVGDFLLLRDNERELFDTRKDHSPNGYRNALLEAIAFWTKAMNFRLRGKDEDYLSKEIGQENPLSNLR